MAGPKGGAPRRSHTKSRGGCTECKKRHLRCDETFPQCTNCTKHRTRCPYNETDREWPDLIWTEQATQEIETWRQTGQSPFQHLALAPAPNPGEYSTEELRLIHYVLALYDGLEKNDTADMTVWAHYIPAIVSMGVSHKYVMHALMSFAASNIANRTNCPLVGQLGLDYRGYAMAGMREAVQPGAQLDGAAEPIVMASLVLSWRADDWSSWHTLMKGIADATRSIQFGPQPSPLESFLSNEYELLAMLPESAASERRPRAPAPHALKEWKEAQSNAQKVWEQLKQRKKSAKLMKQLLDLLEGVGKVPSYRSADDQFHRLRNLRNWVFWLPAMTLDAAEPTADELVAIAYYYTVALLAQGLCPEIGTAQLANISVGPITKIWRRVRTLNREHNGEFNQQMEQLRYPMAVLRDFQARIGFDDHRLSLHGSELGDFQMVNVSPMSQQLLGVPSSGPCQLDNSLLTSSGVPVSPSLSVHPAVTHNSPVTPVFSVVASHSPVSSVYTGFDVSPITPIMSGFAQTTHGYESSPMTQTTTHGYGSPMSSGYPAYHGSPMSGDAHSYTDSPMSNEHHSFENSPLMNGFHSDFDRSPMSAVFPPLGASPYQMEIALAENRPATPDCFTTWDDNSWGYYDQYYRPAL